MFSSFIRKLLCCPIPKLTLPMLVCLLLGSINAQAGLILADSQQDWIAATADGIGVGNTLVTAGSALDAAQQEHSATNNGIWNYKGTDSPGGDTFAATPGFLTNWDAGAYKNSGSTRIGETFMAPVATHNNGTYAVREWVGNGLAGSQVNVRGSFTTGTNNIPINAFNNGVDVYVLLDSFVIGSALLAPNGDTYQFDFLLNVADQPRIRFAVGPDGPIGGATGFNNFFNDGVHFSAVIEHVGVPTPAAILFFCVGLLSILRWRPIVSK